MSVSATLILSIHYLLVSVLCLYGAHRIYHSLVAKRLKRNFGQNDVVDETALTKFPHVTIQIPLYNEKFVAARIIESVSALQYPQDRLQIQILDDSTDTSTEIIAQSVSYYQRLGFDIDHIRRPVRRGYKAGALADAMSDVKGEFIAIFDADFLPEPDFLIKALPSFRSEKVGLVQTRWTYLNTNKNMLTRLQTIMLDAHFGIEQLTRSSQKVFFNFNGTAGIWRKAAIDDAGGWTSDTLTEDTDLSYRAQMRGWEFIYRPDICSPSELPEDMRAFKVQQHRWAKGTIEVMKKILFTIWGSNVRLKNKIEATFHLTANLTYLLMFIDSVFFLLPAVHIRQQMDPNFLVWFDIPIFAFASLSHAYFFLSGQKRLYGKVSNKLIILPALLATSIGLGVNNGRAVIEALFGYKTGFVRTPKTGNDVKQWAGAQVYKTDSQMKATFFELFMAVLYSSFLIWALAKNYWIVVPFLVLFAGGFFYTSCLSLLEARGSRQTDLRETPIKKVRRQDIASDVKQHIDQHRLVFEK